jgi:N-acetyl-anhydromuramyl-L-alanine amidase AmpD
MLYITKDGHVDAGARIKMKIISNIENGKMEKVNGIVVHQTGGPTAESALSQYRTPKANGAHFLIDKDGTIYQTASLYKVTNHVGKMQSRCVVTRQCSPAEFKRMHDLESAWKPTQISRIEEKKSFPDRFPSNTDAIGIELVGEAPGKENKEVFVEVTDAQNASLQWLTKELMETLNVSMSEVYKHPHIARKNKTEARSAKW